MTVSKSPNLKCLISQGSLVRYRGLLISLGGYACLYKPVRLETERRGPDNYSVPVAEKGGLTHVYVEYTHGLTTLNIMSQIERYL